MSTSGKWASKSCLIAVFLLVAAMVQAQENAAFSKISLGFVMGFPTGKTAKVYVNGYGASVKAEYNIASAINLTGSAGYLVFRYRDDVKKRLDYNGEETRANGVLPIKLGAKYYFAGIYYAAIEVGTANTLGDRISSSFSYSPTLGVYLPFSKSHGADLGLRYEGWKGSGGQVSFFGLRLAFAIGKNR